MKHTAPGSLSHIIFLHDLFYLPFIFRSIKPKIQNTFLQFILFGIRSINLLQIYLTSVCLLDASYPGKGLTTPLTRWVARICYLCAGAAYFVLLGSPTGSITLVSYLREIPTADVLHHPFLLGGN